MWQALKDLISGAAAFFRFSEKKQDLANTPAMQDNERARQDQSIRAAATQAIADCDLAEIRRQAAEK